MRHRRRFGCRTGDRRDPRVADRVRSAQSRSGFEGRRSLMRRVGAPLAGKHSFDETSLVLDWLRLRRWRLQIETGDLPVSARKRPPGNVTCLHALLRRSEEGASRESAYETPLSH
jgi:hypothetical protein